jgi:hypothetical protein
MLRRRRAALSCDPMSDSADASFAWEPLTPRGVAAFARARLSRLLLVQLVVASLAATAVIWFLSNGWFSTVRAAIRSLPATGAIRSGRLDWPGNSPQLLADDRLLAFIVDTNHSGQVHSPADVQFEFSRETVRVYSLLGYAEWTYPRDWTIACNRTELEPVWGAWEPEWLAITVLAVVAGLLLVWALLATVYFVPAWLIAFVMNRALDFRGSWKLAGAAVLPGGLLLTVAIVLYGLGGLDLVQCGFCFSLHFVLGWVYLFVSQFFLPRLESTPKRNPFSSRPA